MKLLRIVLIALVVIAVAVVGIAFLLPAEFAVQGSAMIPAPPDTVYARFATPRTWARWSAWTTRQDPTLVYTYAGADSGVGAIMKWTSRKMGNGQLEIVEALPGRTVRYELRFTDNAAPVRGQVDLEPVEGGTHVTWSDTGGFGKNPLMRLFHPMLKAMMRKAYEESFANLRREAQGG